MSTQIVKVQRAIIPANGPALIYDEKRRYETQQPLDISTKNALAGDLKGYFRANFANGQWHIGARVGDRLW